MYGISIRKTLKKMYKSTGDINIHTILPIGNNHIFIYYLSLFYFSYFISSKKKKIK